MALLARPPGAKLPADFPCLAIWLERFANPVKRVRRDLGEAPAHRHAVGACANLDDVFTYSPADLFREVVARRVNPPNAPRLDRGIPRAEGRAVHVHRLLELCRARRARG